MRLQASNYKPVDTLTPIYALVDQNPCVDPSHYGCLIGIGLFEGRRTKTENSLWRDDGVDIQVRRKEIL